MMIAGFEPATHGEIILDNRPDQQFTAAQAQYRHGLSELRSFPHMTVAENIGYPFDHAKGKQVRNHEARGAGSRDGQLGRVGFP